MELDSVNLNSIVFEEGDPRNPIFLKRILKIDINLDYILLTDSRRLINEGLIIISKPKMSEK